LSDKSRLGACAAKGGLILFTKLISRLVPAEWVGSAEFWSRDYRRFFPWGGAMNGQTARLEATRAIIQRAEIQLIVETGTFRGVTTEWLAGFGVSVISVEVNPRYQIFAKKRLGHFANVSVRLGTSTEILRNLAGETSDARIPALFYLDAHWRDYLPLGDELRLICSAFDNAYVLVDDFQVPDDIGYEYDDYGPGQELTLSYLKKHSPRPPYVFFPAVPSKWETGRKRGWVVLTWSEGAVDQLRRIPGLRPWDR
jgi:hypothetical protein